MSYATLSIQVTAVCPECDNSTDLMDENESGDLNEEGFISRQALPDGCWHTKHKDFKSPVKCCYCGHDFEVNGLLW